MAKTVFRPHEIKTIDEKVMFKLPHSFEPEVEEVPEIEEPVYEGPTAEDLRQEAEEFKVQWEAEKQQMLEQAQAAADEIVAKAEKAAFEEVKRQSDQAQVIRSEAEQESAEMLRKAQEEADALVADAQAERQRITDDAYKSGFAEGQEKGFAEGNMEAQRLIDRLHVIMDRIMDKRQEKIDSAAAKKAENDRLLAEAEEKLAQFRAEEEKHLKIADFEIEIKKFFFFIYITLKVYQIYKKMQIRNTSFPTSYFCY